MKDFKSEYQSAVQDMDMLGMKEVHIDALSVMDEGRHRKYVMKRMQRVTATAFSAVCVIFLCGFGTVKAAEYIGNVIKVNEWGFESGDAATMAKNEAGGSPIHIVEDEVNLAGRGIPGSEEGAWPAVPAEAEDGQAAGAAQEPGTAQAVEEMDEAMAGGGNAETTSDEDPALGMPGTGQRKERDAAAGQARNSGAGQPAERNSVTGQPAGDGLTAEKAMADDSAAAQPATEESVKKGNEAAALADGGIDAYTGSGESGSENAGGMPGDVSAPNRTETAEDAAVASGIGIVEEIPVKNYDSWEEFEKNEDIIFAQPSISIGNGTASVDVTVCGDWVMARYDADGKVLWMERTDYADTQGHASSKVFPGGVCNERRYTTPQGYTYTLIDSVKAAGGGMLQIHAAVTVGSYEAFIDFMGYTEEEAELIMDSIDLSVYE